MDGGTAEGEQLHPTFEAATGDARVDCPAPGRRTRDQFNPGTAEESARPSPPIDLAGSVRGGVSSRPERRASPCDHQSACEHHHGQDDQPPTGQRGGDRLRGGRHVERDPGRLVEAG